MPYNKDLDAKIEENYKKKLKAMQEAEAQKNEYGAATRGGGASNEEGRRRIAAYEKAKRDYDMAQRVRNERNASNRT